MVPPSTEPAQLAERIDALARPLLLGLDVDGTLAPIVSTPDRSRLLPGVTDALEVLCRVPLVHVAIVSGRSRRELRERFPFPACVHLIGSHGLELDGVVELSPPERRRLGAVTRLVGQAAARAPGAWVESKPAGVALHVRTAEPDAGEEAASWLLRRLQDDTELHVLPGRKVVDVAVRAADKGTAITHLRRRLEVASACYVGDDVTDEKVFAVLGPDDLGVKVGRADTAATARLGEPADVADLLGILATAWGGRVPGPMARAGGGSRTPTGHPTGT